MCNAIIVSWSNTGYGGTSINWSKQFYGSGLNISGGRVACKLKKSVGDVFGRYIFESSSSA